MAFTLTLTSPDGTLTGTVVPTRLTFDAELGDPSTLEAEFVSDWELFDDEGGSDNPLQLNSNVELSDGTTLFKGFVFSRELVQTRGERTIRVSCLDPLGKLMKTLAGNDDGGSTVYNFTLSSPELALTEDALKRQPNTTGIDFWPVTTSNAWLPIGKENSTTLADDIAAAATEFKAETAFNGMSPSGFVRIDDEWIYYDAYNEKDDGYWWFQGCGRGALGTVVPPGAQSHLADATVTQRTSQLIHPAVAVKLERREDGGDWEVIPAQDYTVMVNDGYFAFYADPTVDPFDDFEPNNMRATYSVFDEDHADTIKLADILDTALKLPAADGGPGLAAGGIDVDIDEIRLTRVRLDKPTDTFDLITRLLDELGFMKGADTDTIGLHYVHSSGKVTIENIIQQTTADHVFYEATQVDSDFNLEGLFSAVMVVYQDPRPVNLTGPDMVWHYKDLDTVPVSTDDIRDLWWLEEDESGLSGWKNTTDDGGVASRQFETGRLFDGFSTTGMGMRFEFDVDPARNGAIDLFFFWFGTELVPATVTVDEITCHFDARSVSLLTGDAEPLDLEIVGVTSLAAPVADAMPVTSGEVRLGGGARLQIDGSEFGNIDGTPHFVISAKEIGQEIQGLIFRFRGLSYETAGKGRGAHALIKELRVTGRQNRTALVQLTNLEADGTDPQYLLAKNSYNKLFDSTYGMHRVKVLEIGPASTGAAISLGRLALQQALALFNRRTYIIPSIGTVPALGQTVTMPDNYTGVVLGVAFTMERGEQRLQLDVLDFLTDIV